MFVIEYEFLRQTENGIYLVALEHEKILILKLCSLLKCTC